MVHDLAYAATTANPAAVRDLLPASLLVAAGLGVTAAVLGAVRRAYPLALVVLGLAAAAPLASRYLSLELPKINQPFLVLPKALLLLLFGCGLILSIGRRFQLSLPIAGFACGLIMSGGLDLLRSLRWQTSDPLLLLQVASVIGGLLVLVGAASPRHLHRALLLLSPFLLLTLSLIGPIRKHTTLRRADLPSDGPGPSGAVPGPNLVLITLDTVRADHLAPYGYARATTPRLDEFVESHAIKFSNARSTSSWTLPSHASLLTGEMPAVHGATHPRVRKADALTVSAWPAYPLRRDLPTLAEILRARGFSTAAIVANNAYLPYEFGLDRGFERYDDGYSQKSARGRSALAQLFGLAPHVGTKFYRDAEAINRLAIRWLRSRDRNRPFFLFLNYMDPHDPYIPARSSSRAFSVDVPADPVRYPKEMAPLLYDRELLYLDHFLDELFRFLMENEDFDNTVILITSDHGEAFGTHGSWGHDITLYDELIKVPLYLKPQGVRKSKNIDTAINGADVFYLLLDHLGITPPPRRRGSDAMVAEWYRSEELTRARGRVDIDRDLVSWLDGDFKYIVDSASGVEIFNLRDDPQELRNLADGAERTQGAVEKAQQWWLEHPPAHEVVEGSLGADTRERLRALGYID